MSCFNQCWKCDNNKRGLCITLQRKVVQSDDTSKCEYFVLELKKG